MLAMKSIPTFVWLSFLLAGGLVNVVLHTRNSISIPCTNGDALGSFVSPRSLPREENDEISIVRELYDAVSRERLTKIAKQYRDEYAAGSPFPNIAIDNIFPERILQEVLKENPESMIEDGCVKDSSLCYRKKKENMKSAISEEHKMGLYTKLLFGTMKSSNFITFLEQLTGIRSILPDPHYHGSGMHFTAPGGSLDVHEYSNFGLDRRVNAFIYLNPEWPEEYGGHLELWSKDMTSCRQRILPTLGRFVVFSTTDFSFHGHPQPLGAPQGRARRSLALYYYTNGRPAEECRNQDCKFAGHATLFQTPVGCAVCQETTCKAFDDSYRVPTWIAVNNDTTTVS